MTQLTILQINDTHSYLELHPEHFFGPDGIEIHNAGGYARLKTLVDKIRRENDHVLLFDNGDTIHGTYDAVASRGWHMVPVLQTMAFDAMTFHWDSAYTPANLKAMEEALGYPILALNCYDEVTGETFFQPYLMKEIAGLKVAILGLAADFIDKLMPEPFYEGVRFSLGREELPGIIHDVRQQGADLVILLSHNGFPQDVQLLKEIPGIDLCLSSHTHNRLEEPVRVGDAILIQSGSHGSYLGKLVLELDHGIQAFAHELLLVDETVPEDEAMSQLIDEVLAKNRGMLSETIGCTETPLHRATALTASMDDLLLASLLHVTDATIAFSNGWRYGAPIRPGPITLEDVYRMVPMNAPLTLATLTGQEIWDLIEDNLQATYACDPYEQKGGYVKRMRGLTVYLKLENPCQLKIQTILVGAEVLDRNREYSVVYLTRQAVPKDRFGHDHRDSGLRVVDAMRDYLKGDCYRASGSPSVIVI